MTKNTTPKAETQQTGPDMLRAALWYARQGLHIFPVHEPIFDHPLGYTCSCEMYRHSEECKANHRYLYLDPDSHCVQPGKCPRVRWGQKSTTETKDIRRWWGWWPTANIGVDCGKSGLLVLDLDAYKEEYDGDKLLSRAEEETVTTLTGGGGVHLWYNRPADKSWGNANKGLPAGIDVRGVGGYVVAAPSLHKSGRRYAFETGYELSQMDLLPVPGWLADMLDSAQRGGPGRSGVDRVRMVETTTARPDLDAWTLSEQTLAIIHHPPERGQRSEADYRVCLALCYAGATDTDILAVFQHYPIGAAGKFSERGLDYLERTVTSARAYVDRNPGPEQVRAMIPALREWVKTTSFADFVPLDLQSRSGYRTDSTDTKIADALLDVCEERGTWNVIISPRDLALRAGLGSHHTANKALDRLAGWFADRGDAGLIHVARRFPIEHKGGGEKMGNLRATYSKRKADDVFLSGRSRLAKKLGNEEPGLGEVILRVVDALAGLGTATRRELADHTAKSPHTIGRACRRAEGLGILDSEREGGAFSAKEYSLADAWQDVCEELRPTLKTYNLGLERTDRVLEGRQRFAERQLERKDLEQEERAAFTRRRSRAIAQRLTVGPVLRPELTKEEQYRYIVEPVAAMTPSKAAYDERRTQEYEGLMSRANALLSGGLLASWELMELRTVAGRLGVDLATITAVDSAEGYTFAYGR